MIRFGKSKSFTNTPIDPQACRLIGLTLETGAPILAPRGHATLFSANGGGKTTKGAMVWLQSLAASQPNKAILFLDSKEGEGAIQAAAMLAKLGRKVAVIDDIGVWPELEPYRIHLNPFGAAVSTFKRDQRDLIFALENITNALIEEPEGDAKNKYWRAWPRNLIEYAARLMLNRDPDLATPGACASILADRDMMKTFAEIEAQEGDPALKAQARAVLDMQKHEHFPMHLEEAQRALKLFSAGTRLHEVGRNAEKSHEDLIREGYVIFLVGPQANITRLGAYYALHILAFTNALYRRVGALRIIADEYTNCPLKPLIAQTTTVRSYGGEIFYIGQSRSESVRKFGEQETRTIEENAIVKQWFGFSSFEEAERVSKAMGEEHAVASTLGGDNTSARTQTNLSLIKQRHLSAAELLAMPSDQQLVHIKGIGFFVARTLGQDNVAPYCNLIAENPLEGGRLKPDPLIELVTPGKA